MLDLRWNHIYNIALATPAIKNVIAVLLFTLVMPLNALFHIISYFSQRVSVLY